MTIRKLILGLVCFAAVTAPASIPTDCGDDKECLIELPGSQCADGTPNFFTLTKRKDAKNVLVYLSGGGACWSAETCEAGYAVNLSRYEEATDWNQGGGIHTKEDPSNPVGRDYNIITVPYCTGDSHLGSRTSEYGQRHFGYDNVVKMLEAVKKLYPSPEKAMMVGCSAGGFGAFGHLENFARTFPDARKYVVSDAGTPFRPPHVKADSYLRILKAWGADKNLPVDPETGKPITDMGELARYNKRQFPEVRFGLISSYNDKIMTFFAWAVGSPSPLTAVKSTIVDVADNFLGADAPNAKVFFTNGDRHCHTPYSLQDANLGRWLGNMVDDAEGWNNVRPQPRPFPRKQVPRWSEIKNTLR